MPDEQVYATLGDIVARYGPIPEGQESRVPALLEDASQMLRDALPNAVERASELTLKRIVCRMVWEALDHSAGAPMAMPGAESTQWGAGVFQQSFRFTNPTGRLFISKEDRRLLRGGPVRAGTINVTGPQIKAREEA